MTFTSERDQARQMAQEMLSQDPVFLDTETTGIGQNDEVVEISVLDPGGEALVDGWRRTRGERRHHL